MNRFDYLHESVDDFFMEKKTKTEYTIDRFKKKYNFVPDSPGSKTGKITMYGKTFDVDFDTKNSLSVVGGKFLPRQLMADLNSNNGKIIIDNVFFKLKNDKRREAVLAHEVGHQQMHSPNIDNKMLRSDLLNNTQYDVNKRELVKKYIKSKKLDPNSELVNNAVGKKIDKDYSFYKLMSDLNSNTPKGKERSEMINYLKKYERDNAPHTTTMELEADRYAANKTGENTFKKSMREYSKRSNSPKEIERREGFRDKNFSKELSKSLKKRTSVDEDIRKRALKDEKTKKSNIYK